MVKDERGILKSRSFHFRKMFDMKQANNNNSANENGNVREVIDEKMQSKNEVAALLVDEQSVLDNKAPVKEGAAASGPPPKKERGSAPSGIH